MINTTAGKVALVTGASSGIGEATALELAKAGYTVHAAARRVERMNHLTESGIRPISMDVTDDSSMQAAVEKIIADTGRIDVLVNNAGYGSYGALEDVPMDEARYQFEVNVFGAARLTQLVLPHMRKNRSGKIVNITSMGGKIHTPLGAWYHATKFALEAISDCLRLELKPFGIDVIVIEPGGIRSEWADIAADKVRAVSSDGPYAPQGNAVANSLSSESNQRRSSPGTDRTHYRQGRAGTQAADPLRRRLRCQTDDLPPRRPPRPHLRRFHATHGGSAVELSDRRLQQHDGVGPIRGIVSGIPPQLAARDAQDQRLVCCQIAAKNDRGPSRCSPKRA
jgi:NAD(P)-dependent dehydrogenase (short-subunit alcohol dehydrogenase family)